VRELVGQGRVARPPDGRDGLDANGVVLGNGSGGRLVPERAHGRKDGVAEHVLGVVVGVDDGIDPVRREGCDAVAPASCVRRQHGRVHQNGQAVRGDGPDVPTLERVLDVYSG